ncbi:MAG: phage minor head protein [Chitinophagaceae bacterium]
MWKEKGMPSTLSDDLVKYYAEQLWQAIAGGYGDDLTTVDFDTPDEQMLQKLQENVWQFSAAKNYSQLKALSEALVDSSGKIREYSEFKKAASAINQEHAGRFLQAEYNMAIGSGQFASKWVDIQRDKELLPLLEFSAIIDGHTSDICLRLDGIIRPVDDILWEQWYPPNHWGERSDVLQQADGTVTPLDDIIYPDKVPAMFKRNMAKEGWAFPEGHPYYTGNPDGVKATANKLRKKYGQ